MGQILSSPVTNKETENAESDTLAYAISCMQGWRVTMEDAHATKTNLETDGDDGVGFFGVYDGHGGDNVAKFTGENLHHVISRTDAFKKANYAQALKDGFLACDRAIKESHLSNDTSGCTATTVIITKDRVFCGNAGDSRTVLSVNGQAKALSFDHKPTNEGERTRIVAAGGFVDIGRVNGNLALSRAIGDFEFKKNELLSPEEQMVTSYPDVLEHVRNYKNDEFIVLACDGIWDCLSSQQVVDFVIWGVVNGQSLSEICESMIDVCIAPGSDGTGVGCDNMSVCILSLLAQDESLEQWTEKIVKRYQTLQLEDPDTLCYKMYQISLGEKLENQQAPPEQEQGLQQRDNVSIPFQDLFSNGSVKSENGVIYLDTSSTSSLLNSLGFPSGLEDDSSEEKVEEVTDDDNEL